MTLLPMGWGGVSGFASCCGGLSGVIYCLSHPTSPPTCDLPLELKANAGKDQVPSLGHGRVKLRWKPGQGSVEGYAGSVPA